jgi:FKBP-type peptidyl-prolyl cis-trans isomerase FkpA
MRLTSILFIGLLLPTAAACTEKIEELPSDPRAKVTAEPAAPEPADLIKEDLVVGTGAEAKDGDKVTVNYTGKLLKNGKVFDTSIGPGKKPFPVTIGTGGVIKGWDLGLPGMKVGGKRKLTIPSKLGYKEAGSPPKIPPNATLVFEIELLSVGEEPKDAGAEGGAKEADKKTDKKTKEATTKKAKTSSE